MEIKESLLSRRLVFWVANTRVARLFLFPFFVPFPRLKLGDGVGLELLGESLVTK
ncbi:hypothetical protein [Haladaptatus caseinilyticus]|uniref:hypothetical protein n=1 Tax=Haladaptatus caseinilyticus TaxID=2993314 RepID=UPI00224B03BC|nr:hypothetical protein [Haladaptatus caseinilyticus]